MRFSKKWFEKQSDIILDENEEIGGGRGWRLVDLNVPLPLPDCAWLSDQLSEREVMCEFPECDAQAIGLLAVGGHVGFICRFHTMICTTGDKHLMNQGKADLAYAMLRCILDTTYGVSTRLASTMEQLAQPLQPWPTPKPRGPVEVTPLLPRVPRFGQF